MKAYFCMPLHWGDIKGLHATQVFPRGTSSLAEPRWKAGHGMSLLCCFVMTAAMPLTYVSMPSYVLWGHREQQSRYFIDCWFSLPYFLFTCICYHRTAYQQYYRTESHTYRNDLSYLHKYRNNLNIMFLYICRESIYSSIYHTMFVTGITSSTVVDHTVTTFTWDVTNVWSKKQPTAIRRARCRNSYAGTSKTKQHTARL
jgi:hypothetical protein